MSWTVWILESTVCTHGKVLVLDGDRRQGLTCTVESHMIVRSYRRTAIYLRKCRPTALPFYLSFFSLLDHVIKKCQEALVLSSWNWQVQKMHGRPIGSFIPKKNSRLRIHFEALSPRRWESTAPNYHSRVHVDILIFSLSFATNFQRYISSYLYMRLLA